MNIPQSHIECCIEEARKSIYRNKEMIKLHTMKLEETKRYLVELEETGVWLKEHMESLEETFKILGDGDDD